MSDQPSAGRGRGRGGGRGRGRGQNQPPSRGTSSGGQATRGDGSGRGYRGERGSGRGEGRGGGRGGFHGGGQGDARGSFRGDGRGTRGGRGGRGGGLSRDLNAPSYFQQDYPCAPDEQVQKLEDHLGSASGALSALKIKDQVQLTRRPGYGTLGKAVNVWTNYFHLTSESDKDLYRYSVSFQREETSKRKKRKYIEKLLQDPIFRGVYVATDFAQILVASNEFKLAEQAGKLQTFTISLLESEDQAPQIDTPQANRQRSEAKSRNENRLTVQFDCTVSVRELQKSIEDPSGSSYYALKNETVQALNIIFQRFAQNSPNTVAAGRGKFFPIQGASYDFCDLGAGLQALRGFFASVRPSVGRILININVAAAAFYKAGPLIDIVSDFINSGKSMRHLDKFLDKVRVSTHYLKAHDTKGNLVTVTKYKTVVGICRRPLGGSSKQVSFKWRDPSKPGNSEVNISVYDYFLKQYGIRLSHPDAPIANVGTTQKPSWLPMELCTMEPGQLARMVLSASQTADMVTFACRAPSRNAQALIDRGLDSMGVVPLNRRGGSDALEPFGIQVGTKMLSVQARILIKPSLLYGKSKTDILTPGKWNLMKKRFTLGAKLKRWGCLSINRDFPQGNVREFTQALNSYGMQVAEAKDAGRLDVRRRPSPMNSQATEDWKAEVKNRVELCFRDLAATYEFLLVLLSDQDSYVRDEIKRVAETDLGIMTACCLFQKFTKPNNGQYFGNEALKFNLKLGGINHHLHKEHLPGIDEKTMLVGIDVTHPSPGSKENAPSIAASVASVDGYFAQYRPAIKIQTRRKEMVTELKEMLASHLRFWSKMNNGQLPTRVVVYRDGVSEGEYQTVLADEGPQFASAFKDVYPTKVAKPKLTIIVCGKRHHTRFYPANEANQQLKNVTPGTVVDRGVTGDGEQRFDFFLVAHEGLQGTSRPAHYIVIKDENRFTADQLQTLTHNLCYTFGRATRSVSLCPPAYYADILCERGRAYLHHALKDSDGATSVTSLSSQSARSCEVHPNLADRMYFI